MTSKGMFKRSDLIYREIDKRVAEGDAPLEAEQMWSKFDEVTAKVIDNLHFTDVANWDSEAWRTFQKLLQMRKSPTPELALELRGLSTTDLKKTLTSSDGHSSS